MKKKILPATKRLLMAMVDAYGDLLLSALHAHNFDRVLHPEYYKAKERDRREREARRALWALKESKMVAIQKKGGKLYFALTQKGQRWMLHHQMAQARQCPSGECVIVIFDIPETQRTVRDTFRRFLAEHSFRQLQRSVWVSEYDVLALLQEFIRRSDTKQWVNVFTARNVLQ